VVAHSDAAPAAQGPKSSNRAMNKNESEYRKQLAAELRQAIEESKPSRAMPQETTCDWCGIDLHTIDDHKIVDRQFICNPCHSYFFPEQEMER
jgi:hypothetical protein